MARNTSIVCPTVGFRILRNLPLRDRVTHLRKPRNTVCTRILGSTRPVRWAEALLMVPIARRIRCGHGAGGHSRIGACVAGARQGRPQTRPTYPRNVALMLHWCSVLGQVLVLVVSTGFSHVLGRRPVVGCTWSHSENDSALVAFGIHTKRRFHVGLCR